MKILIMKFRNIGDVLLCTPLINALAKLYPQASIDFACNDYCVDMLSGHRGLNAIFPYPRTKLKGLNIWQRVKAELKYAKELKKQKYDLAINTTSGDRGAFLAWYIGAKTRIGFKPDSFLTTMLLNKFIKLDQNIGLHAIEQNLLLLSTLNSNTSFCKKVSLAPSKSLDIKLDDKFVHFHITSRWMFKCASDELMAELIDFCAFDLGLSVVLTGDGSEIESKKIKDVLALSKARVLNLNGKLNLKQTAALAAKARAYVGVDTAIMHIAAALDTPVVALFGPSRAWEWGPWDNDLNENGYKAKNGNAFMGRHKIFQKSWDCAPCSLAGCDDLGSSKCLLEWEQNEKAQIKMAIRQAVNFKQGL